MSQTVPPTITAPPSPAPQRGDRATFSARVDAFITWLIAAVTQFAALASNVYSNAVDVYNNALAAQASANAAANSAASATTNGAAQVNLAANQVSLAQAQAQAAAASAITATNAPGTNATSLNSLSLALGAKSLTIQTGKALSSGLFLIISRAADPTTYMLAQIQAYNSATGALDVLVLDLRGAAGTYTGWVVSTTGRPGLGVPLAASPDAGKVATVNQAGDGYELTSPAFNFYFQAAQTY